jgi:hypothetical protein
MTYNDEVYQGKHKNFEGENMTINNPEKFDKTWIESYNKSLPFDNPLIEWNEIKNLKIDTSMIKDDKNENER